MNHLLCNSCAKNPLHTFPCNFPVDGEAANMLQTCHLCYGKSTISPS